jgi:hypothetical protein
MASIGEKKIVLSKYIAQSFFLVLERFTNFLSPRWIKKCIGIFFFLIVSVMSLFFPKNLFSLDHQPWFGDIYQFYFTSKYAYSTYSSVDDSVKPLGHRSHDHLLYFGLDLPVSTEWSFDTDLHFVDTPRQSFSFSSMAFQGRYLWLDDIVGDPVTLTTGLSTRYVSSKSLRDVSCPFHGDLGFEGTLAIGKESAERENWRFRVWALSGLGCANVGSPWIRGLFAFESNIQARHKLGVFTELNQGFGPKKKVDIDHFYGYGKIRYRWVDLRFRYGVKMGTYGTLRFEYQRRLVAKRAPQDVNTFAISYFICFSF